MKTFVVITLCIAIVINIIVGNMYAFDFQGYFDRVNEVTNFSLMKRLYPVWNNNWYVAAKLSGALPNGLFAQWFYDTEFGQSVYNTGTRLAKTFEVFGDFIEWAIDVAAFLEPWNYFMEVDYFDWGSV